MLLLTNGNKIKSNSRPNKNDFFAFYLEVLISIFLFCHLPFFTGTLVFLILPLDLTTMRATASYSYERLVAVAIEPYAADQMGFSQVDTPSMISSPPPSTSKPDCSQCPSPIHHHPCANPCTAWLARQEISQSDPT